MKKYFLLMMLILMTPKLMGAVESYQSDTVITSTYGIPTVIKVVYANPTGWKNLKEMTIWVDNFTPRGYRLNYSLHGKLIKQIDGAFKLFGERLVPGRNNICGGDADFHHCYQNFAWDVGGWPLVNNVSKLIYMNHDAIVSDTIMRTENTIGNVRVVGVREVSNTEVEVSWEITPNKYFYDKILDVYVGGVNENNEQVYGANPSFRTIKRWYVYDTEDNWYDLSKNIIQSDYIDFNNQSELSKFTILGDDKQANIDNQNKYLGGGSVKIDKLTYIERDFGVFKTGLITGYFYDDPSVSTNSFYISVSDSDSSKWNLPTTHTIVLGVNPNITTQNYVYKARLESINEVNGIPSGTNISISDNFRYFDTGVKRTQGWHKFTFWITENGAWAEVEDVSKLLPLANLTLSPPVSDSTKNMMRLSSDREMMNFRYLKIGNWSNASSFNVDEISISSVPNPPVKDVNTLNTFTGALRWENYFSGIWLDMYEESGMFGNMERISANVKANEHPANVGAWWWLSLSQIAFASDIRYKSTGLPFYKKQVEYITKYLLANKGQWAGNDWGGRMSAGSVYTSMTTLLWNDLSEDTREQLSSEYQNFISNLGKNKPVEGYIGNSHGEDVSFATSVPVTAAIIFSTNPKAPDWANLGIKLGNQALSTDRKLNGVKNIYAPGDNPVDCTLPNITSLDCFVPGERANLPADRDFSYLMDNHNYNPHPNYMSGTIDGVMSGPYVAKIFESFGKKPSFVLSDYNVYSPNLWPMYTRLLKFFDYTKNIYVAKDIYRTTNKEECFGGQNCQPMNQEDNSIKKNGIDDWGNLASGQTLNLNFILKSKLVFGNSSFVDGAGNTFNVDQLASKVLKINYRQQYNSIAKQVSSNVFLDGTEDLLNPASNIFILNRNNNLNTKLFRAGLIDPLLPLPLGSVSVTGDYNGDGTVSLADFGTWKGKYLAGQMSLVDFGVWKGAYLK